MANPANPTESRRSDATSRAHLALAATAAERGDLGRVSRTTGMEASTQGCTRHRHPEFVLAYDERRTPSGDVRRLIDALERSVARGERFHAGEGVRVGWLSLRVAEIDAHTLTLLEPDFVPLLSRQTLDRVAGEADGHDRELARTSLAPSRWVPSVDEALGHLRVQQAVVDGAGLGDQITFGSIEHRARVCRHLLERDFSAAIVLDRIAPQGTDSGWMIGCIDDAGLRDGRDEHETVERTLYEIACRWPFLIDFLALPAASTVACTETGEAVIFHEGVETGIRSGDGGPRVSRITRPATLARYVR